MKQAFYLSEAARVELIIFSRELGVATSTKR